MNALMIFSAARASRSGALTFELRRQLAVGAQHFLFAQFLIVDFSYALEPWRDSRVPSPFGGPMVLLPGGFRYFAVTCAR